MMTPQRNLRMIAIPVNDQVHDFTYAPWPAISRRPSSFPRRLGLQQGIWDAQAQDIDHTLEKLVL